MYVPLISTVGGDDGFRSKIVSDYTLIHSPPDMAGEQVLVSILGKAEEWLLHFSQKNIMMVPGHLRAALQTFEGLDVNDISQNTTYSMQHDPSSLLPVLKKFLSFAYRRGLFAVRGGFDARNDFAIAHFLKDLLLERPASVASHPFLVEFCLMYAFRVNDRSERITMISCETVSSVFSKMASVCKASVCSVICSFKSNALDIHGPSLVKAIRHAPVLHILSPIVRQIREMNSRIPKRRKTTLDSSGNITVDEYQFRHDVWSRMVALSIEWLKRLLGRLADGVWWEAVIDG
jgi:hypothetical protein